MATNQTNPFNGITGKEDTDSIQAASIIPKTAKTTLTFKSDFRKSQFDSVRPCSGILHATRTANTNTTASASSSLLALSTREDHAYAWISNYDTIENASAHLANYGFERCNSEFIPYSSKSNWVHKYPHAFPYIDCDTHGHVTGFPFWSPFASSALDIPPEIAHVAMQPLTAAAMTTKRNNNNGGGGLGGVRRVNMAMASTTRGGMKTDTINNINTRLPGALLTHTERNQLHKEIYNYFLWLSDRVDDMETTDAGRRAVKKVCVHALELRAIVNKLESAFKFAGCSKHGSTRSFSSQQQQLKKSGTSSSTTEEANSTSTTLPLLEEFLVDEMANLAAAEDEGKKRVRVKVKAGVLPNAESSTSSTLKRKRTVKEVADNINPSATAVTTTSLDFDTMFDKLVAYKNEQCGSVVTPDAQLSSWVSELRIMKKLIVEECTTNDSGSGAGSAPVKSDDNDLEDKDAAVSTAVIPITSNDPAASISMQKNEYLTPERIQRLDSIGFDWSISPQQPSIKQQTKSRSWDDRLNDLKQWGDAHAGTFNVPRATSLGEWLHSQRQLYSKRDAKFMANKAPRMEAIGYVFDLRENNSVSWDDRFKQLVEFHEKHGNFDVLPPVKEEEAPDNQTGVNSNEEIEEKFKFYRWVCRLHNEYRAFEKGTSSKLNAERIDKLKGIGFFFKGPKNRGRPRTESNCSVPAGLGQLAKNAC